VGVRKREKKGKGGILIKARGKVFEKHCSLRAFLGTRKGGGLEYMGFSSPFRVKRRIVEGCVVEKLFGNQKKNPRREEKIWGRETPISRRNHTPTRDEKNHKAVADGKKGKGEEN